jgi:predicted dinucleotide-binding enzyme
VNTFDVKTIAVLGGTGPQGRGLARVSPRRDWTSCPARSWWIEGSATEQAAAILSDATVVGAFHNVSAILMDDSEVTSIVTDVLVLGDDCGAIDLVQAPAANLISANRLRGARVRAGHGHLR